MDKNKFKNSLFFKAIATLSLPIFIFGIIFSMSIMAFQYEYPEIEESSSFYESNSFKDEYLNEILSNSDKGEYLQLEINMNIQTEEIKYRYSNKFNATDGIIYYDNRAQYDHNNERFIYLIVDEVKKEAYTNIVQTVETDTIAEIKQKVSQEKYYWNLNKNGIETTIEKLKEDSIKYDYRYENTIKNLKGKEIYTYIEENEKNNISKTIYEIVSKWHERCFGMLVISTIFTILITIYLCVSIGHKSGKEEIYLNKIDIIPLEIIFTIIAIVLTLLGGLIALSGTLMQKSCSTGINMILFSGYIFTEACLVSAGIFIKKLKARQLLKNSLTYKILRWMKNKIKNMIKFIKENISTSKKIALYYWGFIIVSIILAAMAATGIGLILLIALWIWVFKKMIDYKNQFENVKNALKSIYEGNTDINLNNEELCDVLKEMSKYIEDIAGGFSNAIKENIKNERMKTELITNVSHDIKTPLTSIINYVDLLKSENIENEKAKEYLQILDNKSQRLKKLIEDLVEASKASSGNIKLNKEKIDVKELVKQVTGEFEDKFKKKGLEIIADYSEENMEIWADNRYMYRIIENLFSNISKYALENSRVYVDLLVIDNHKIISIKNISKEKLNISPEELMQRFVRGDKSRNTEGSGLGLSIAQSLTELQDGKFNIYVDGDLFKVVIEF